MPQELDGKLHKLDVRVKRSRLKFRARQTYIAEPDLAGADENRDRGRGAIVLALASQIVGRAVTQNTAAGPTSSRCTPR